MYGIGILGSLLVGFTILAIFAFKLARERTATTWTKLILSLSSGWVLAYTVTSAVLFLRRTMEIQVETMNLTLFMSSVAFISFQLLLYDLFNELKEEE